MEKISWSDHVKKEMYY